MGLGRAIGALWHSNHDNLFSFSLVRKSTYLLFRFFEYNEDALSFHARSQCIPSSISFSLP